MRILIDCFKPDKKLQELEYPQEFFMENSLNERHTKVSNLSGELFIKEYWFQDIIILMGNNESEEAFELNLLDNDDYFIMNFALEGAVSFSFIDLLGNELTGEPTRRFFSSSTALLRPEAKCTFICIFLKKRFVDKLIDSKLDNPFDSFCYESQPYFSQKSIQHPKMLVLIKEIQTANQPHHIRKLFLEAKTLELLSLELEQAEGLNNSSFLNETDLQKLNEAKKIVEEDICTPCSLIELSRRTGLNDYKLKKGFKELFGNTVFGYLAELRMTNAYSLLEKGKSVNEVSEVVGYKNPHHFTVAFKKRFGLLPSHLNK